MSRPFRGRRLPKTEDTARSWWAAYEDSSGNRGVGNTAAATPISLWQIARSSLASFHGFFSSRTPPGPPRAAVLGRPPDFPGRGGSWIDEQCRAGARPKSADGRAPDAGAGGSARRGVVRARSEQPHADRGRAGDPRSGGADGGSGRCGAAPRRRLPAGFRCAGADHRHDVDDDVPVLSCGRIRPRRSSR